MTRAMLLIISLPSNTYQGFLNTENFVYASGPGPFEPNGYGQPARLQFHYSVIMPVVYIPKDCTPKRASSQKGSPTTAR